MPSVYGAIPDAAGNPCQGTVTLTPSAVRGADDGEGILGGARVTFVLDEDGEFEGDLDSGNYRIDIRLRGASTFTREITVPDTNDLVNIRDLLNSHLEVES